MMSEQREDIQFKSFMSESGGKAQKKISVIKEEEDEEAQPITKATKQEITPASDYGLDVIVE